MKKNFLAGLAILGVAGFAGIGGYVVKGQVAGGGSSAGAATPGQQVQTETVVSQQARAWGITTCAPQIAFISNFVVEGSTYTANSISGPRDPNREMFAAAIAADFPQSGLTSWTGMSIAPVSGGGCNIAYQTVIYYPASCTATRPAHFPTFNNPVQFGETTEAYADDSGAATLYLLPAGNGCVTIKHEVLF